jgi:phosphoribosylglycinamide formyltransferase 1
LSESDPGRFRIAVMISGSGSNLQSIIDAAAAGRIPVEIAFVAGNKAEAFGLERARRQGIPAYHVSVKTHGSQEGVEDEIERLIRKHEVNLLCLAGYLKKLTGRLLGRIPGRVINIHPGLLPFLGGPGMYGHHVHERVLELGMKVSGVSIHFVD